MFFVHTTFFFGRESTLARKAARQIAIGQIGDQANVGCRRSGSLVRASRDTRL
jgi:hypothetical protein